MKMKRSASKKVFLLLLTATFAVVMVMYRESFLNATLKFESGAPVEQSSHNTEGNDSNFRHFSQYSTGSHTEDIQEKIDQKFERMIKKGRSHLPGEKHDSNIDTINFSARSLSSVLTSGEIDKHNVNSNANSDNRPVVTTLNKNSASEFNRGGHVLDPALQNLDYPDWWKKAWRASATYGKEHVFVGDKPLFNQKCKGPKLLEGPLFGMVEPREYLKNSKNPCWYNDPKETSTLRCLPYFYLAGVAKCGTTDLYGRLTKHPDVMKGKHKEIHFWERMRYNEEQWTFKDYLDIVGDGNLPLVIEDLQTTGSSVKIFGDFSPSYFFHSLWWPLLLGNERCTEPRVITAQHIRHVYPQAKIILTFRHPTSRLYSRYQSRTDRSDLGPTPKDFHRHVVQSIKTYSRCFEKLSVRQCAYNGTLYSTVDNRLAEGMYPVFMADWLRVWPREQLHIMRYEDYGGHETERIDELFKFLDMAPLNESYWLKIENKGIANSGAKEYKTNGPMLPETKELLDNFYQPFINQFAQILNDKRFLWLDTQH